MRSRWTLIALLTVAVVALAIGVRTVRERRAGGDEGDRPSDASIEQALRQARSDSAYRAERERAAGNPDKSRWVDEIKGFDYADLAPSRRKAFVRYANAQRCTCGCGYTLAGCRTYDPTCPVSGPRVQALLDSVRAGLLPGSPPVRRKQPRGD